jgi:hypothetical protein
MAIVVYWRPGSDAPLWVPVFGRETPMTVASDELNRRLFEWNARYRPDLMPPDGGSDSAWAREGFDLLAEVRLSLGKAYRVMGTDPWWPDEPSSSV